MGYDNTNSGALFRNERRKNDRQPEFTGSINVEGVEYWMSAWVKEAKSSGKKFFSIALTAKDENARAATTNTIDDEAPF